MKTIFDSKKRILLTLSLIFFAVMLLVATLHEDGLLAIYRMEDELSKLKKNRELLKIKNKYLQQEIQELKTDSSGIEKIAREKLNLVYPEELIYRMVRRPPIPAKSPHFLPNSPDLSIFSLEN